MSDFAHTVSYDRLPQRMAARTERSPFTCSTSASSASVNCCWIDPFPMRGPLSALPFTKTVTEPVWRDYEKDFVRCVSVLINSEASLFIFQAIRLQFREGCFDIINLKETSFLGRIA